MFKDEIVKMTSEIVGDSPEILEGICLSVINQLTLRLKEDVMLEDIKDIFITAAALQCAEMYENILGEGAVTSYSAGGISVVKSFSERAEAAQTLLAPYLKDDGFSFLEV